MQSTDLEEIKAALWDQASHPCTRVSWGVAQVMAVKRSHGKLRALLRRQSRWYPVESVSIERPRLCPTGACDLEDVPLMNAGEESKEGVFSKRKMGSLSFLSCSEERSNPSEIE